MLLAHMRHSCDSVISFSILYGQRHRRELQHARKVCKELGIERIEVDLRNLKDILKGSSQTSEEIAVPEGHYASETMRITVVPNRNMLLIAAATALAVSRGYDTVAYAAHTGDHTIYPDCRPEFVKALGQAVRLADWKPVNLVAPFVNMSKAQIVKLAVQLGAQRILPLTYSCYKGGKIHCGKCGTCVERREAFQLAGVPDPTIYET